MFTVCHEMTAISYEECITETWNIQTDRRKQRQRARHADR